MPESNRDSEKMDPLASHFPYDHVYDAGPTGCGELLMQLFLKFRTLEPGEVMKVVSYDPGTWEDIPAWCRMQGHRLLYREHREQLNLFWIEKKR